VDPSLSTKEPEILSASYSYSIPALIKVRVAYYIGRDIIGFSIVYYNVIALPTYIFIGFEHYYR
jgi:hypothetical protein